MSPTLQHDLKMRASEPQGAYRDADKGDERKARSKSAPTGRNKRALEGSGDLRESEEEDAQHRAISSKFMAKKAKVWPAISLPHSARPLLDN